MDQPHLKAMQPFPGPVGGVIELSVKGAVASSDEPFRVGDVMSFNLRPQCRFRVVAVDLESQRVRFKRIS